MLAAVLPDESDGAIARAVMTRVTASGALVPPIWFSEVSNALVIRHRRGRLDATGISTIMDQIGQLPIAADGRPTSEIMGAAVALALAHRLTVYDATCLELARHTSLPLATLDRDLQAAARAEGVPLAPPLE